MSTIKLTPLWLFLILLAILIISILFFKKGSAEGMINFQVQTAPGLSITLPNYTNSLVKLFDNDYFDPKNGNVLRIYGTQFTSSGSLDITGSSIDYIDLLDRNNIVQQYSNTQQIPIYLTTIPSSYNTWNTYTTDPKYTTVTSNELFYISWDDYTYLHVIDMEKNIHATGFIFTKTSSANVPSSFNMANYSKSINVPMPTFKDVNSNNNTFVIDKRLNNNYHLYQLCSTVYYNQNTGDLVIGNYLGYSINTPQQTNNNNYNYYDKNGKLITCFSNSNVAVTNNTWVIEDTDGNNIIIYVNLPNNTTIISILQKNTDNVTYNLIDVKRFLSNGGVQSNASTILPNPDAAALGTITYNCDSPLQILPTGLSAPSGSSPAPSGSSPVPSGSSPVPSGSSPAPSGSSPVHSGSSTTQSGSLCNAQTVVDGLNKSIDDYNTLFTGLNSLQQNMQNTMSRFNNSSNENSCNSSSCDTGCGSNQYDSNNNADVNLMNDASLGYTDFLNSGKMNGMNTSSNVIVPTNNTGGSGIASILNNTGYGTNNLLTNTGVGTNNLLTGVGVGTGNLMTGVGVGTGNLMTGVGVGTGNLMTGVGVGSGNLLTGVGEGSGNLLTGVGVGSGNLLTGVGVGSGNLLTGVGVGTENLLTGVGAGTGNLLTGVGAGTGNLLTDVGEGTGNLMTDVGVGTGNLLSLNSNSKTTGNKSNNYIQNNNPSEINNPLNPLTYNGALVEKPSSNFIPVLTDFSRFGK